MTARSSIGLVLWACACVGTPPAPPVDEGTASGGTDSATGTTASPPAPTTTAADSGSGSAETGPSFEPICGDGIVEPPEECDLGDLNGTGMYCTSECRANACGDGYLGPGESCDDGNESNEDLCSTLCGPTSCGDGVIQGAEECDEGRENALDAACLPSCVSASCGDTFIHEGVETCDTTNVGRATCESQGLGGGVLLCASDCLSFDTSDCEQCENGVLEPGEQCDGSDLNGQTCASQGFAGGTLACAADCTFDTSACAACGNGVVDAGEPCDGADLDGQTCATVLGADYYGGVLACDPVVCAFDTSNCCVNVNGPCMVDSECCSGSCGLMADLCTP